MRSGTACSRLVLGVAAATLLAACSRPQEPASAPAPSGAPAAAAQPTTKPSVAPAAADPVWHYEGAEGPDKWGTLSPKFAACGTGRAQSPIDIKNPAPGRDVPSLKLEFPPSTLRVAHHEHVADGINNGHTVQVNYAGADTLAIGGDAYALVQYHFHNPSEHTLNGKHTPMEMHLVHKSSAGGLAVVGVFIEEGAHNKAFDPVWANLPTRKGVETHYPGISVDVDDLLPSTRTSYRYDGSLTTPPCSEGVKWIVMGTPIALSAQQIGAFTALIHDNNRPTQALNGRGVLTDALTVASR